MAAKEFVRTDKLKPGMMLAENLKDRMDRVLIPKGTILNQHQIHAIFQLRLPGVNIGEPEPDPTPVERPVEVSKEAEENITKIREDDPAKVQLSDSIKQRVSEGIQYLYNDTESDTFSETSNNVTQSLLKAINDSNAIAVDISSLKTSDEYTFKHSVDVATMSMIVAKRMGLPDQDIYNIGISGLLHDMGKSKIPLEVLNKPARLTEEEFEIMKQHSVLGYRILKEKDDFSPQIGLAVLQHHEKMNGKGYPMGVTAEKISPYAKILSVVDVYDALVTERPYKKGMSQRDAIELLMSMSLELDIDVMRHFMSSVILYPVDTIVELSNGEKACVVKNNPDSVLRPTVVGLTSGRVYELATDLACASILIM